jgi:hypothetical protein
VRELQQTQDRKLAELKMQSESEIQELRAEHIAKTEDLYGAIQAIKSQIQELRQTSRDHIRTQISVTEFAQDPTAAAVAMPNDTANATVASTIAPTATTYTRPESPPQLSMKRSLSGSKKPRVSSSPQSNRFELLSESMMDDDEELNKDEEFFPAPSQDEIMASNDQSVDNTVTQVQLLHIQQNH